MTRSILSNWFGLVVLAASTALLTPVMVHHLGAVNYGVWILASSVLDYYGLLDLGMRSAMFRYISLFRGASQREEVDRTFSSALFLVSLTAVLIGLLSVIVAWILPRFLHVQGTTPRVFGWLLFLLGTSVAVMFPTRMLATYISAHNRWDLYNAAGIANTITRAIAIVVILRLGYGILALAIVTVVVAFSSMGQHIVFLFIADPRVHVNRRLISFSRIRELFGFSMRSLLVSLGDYLRFYSDSAVIAAVLTVSLVTPFNVATRLIECFKSIVIAAGGPVFGAMTELSGGGRQQDLKNLLLRSTRFLAFLSILGGVLLIVDGGPLLRLWVGDGFVAAYPVIAILAFGYMINLAQHPMLLIVIAKGQHGPLGWWSIAEGVLNIILSIVWGMSHGLLGVAMGTIVPMLFVKVIIQPWYALKAAELGAWEYLRNGLGRPIVVGLLFAIAARAISISAEPTALVFAAMLASQVSVFIAAVWFFGLDRAERLYVLQYGKRQLGWTLARSAGGLNPSTEGNLRGQE